MIRRRTVALFLFLTQMIIFLNGSKEMKERELMPAQKLNKELIQNATLSINSNQNGKEEIFDLGLFYEIYFSRVLTKLEIKSTYLFYIDKSTKLNDFFQNGIKDNVIFLIEDPEVLKNIQPLIYSRMKQFKNATRGSYAVIYNNSTKILNYVIQDVSNPIFEIEEEKFHEVKKYSTNFVNNELTIISNIPSDDQILITYDNTSALMPTFYLNASNFLCLIFSTLISIWWIFNSFFLYRKFYSAIQKILTGLLIMKIGIVWLLYVYLKISSSYNTSSENDDTFLRMYLETCLTTLNSIYRTLFYLNLALISHGWNIFLSALTRTELVKFIVVYLVIYITICFDQVFDLLMSKCGYFMPSEIKNIALFIGVTLFILRNVFTSIRFLRKKLLYAFHYSPAFLEGLRLKIRMLMILGLISFMYTTVFIAITSIYRMYYDQYEVFENLINLINFNNLDFLCLVLLLLAFRSRYLPENYYTELTTSDNLVSTENIKMKVYRTIYTNDISLPDKELNLIKKKKSNMIIIRNPFNAEEDRMKDLCIGFVCKS